MTTINQLPLLTTLSGGDNLVVWSPNNGDSRRVPYSFVKADIRAGLTLTDLPVATIPLAGTEEMPIVQGGISKRTAINNILNANTIPYIANGLGAVATPSYTFTGDLNTGMWSPDADNIAFSVGGTEAMRIADTGYVGIGTNDPFTTLDMASGFANLAGTVVTDRAVKIGQNRAISTDASLDFHSAGNPSVFNAQFIRYSGVNGSLDLINSGTGNITISANGSERMRITSAGNVGIGTTAPTQRVDIRGGDLLVSRGAASVAEDATIYFGNNNNNFIFGGDNNAMAFYTNGSQRMFLASNGTVGIGTGTPGAKLEVRDTGNTVVLIAGDSTSATQLNFDANTSAVISQKMNAPIIFETNLTEKMRITGGGVVGIGTISPSAAARLEVSSSTSGFLPPRMTTTQRDAISSPPNGLMLYNSTTDKLQVRAAGAWVDLH